MKVLDAARGIAFHDKTNEVKAGRKNKGSGKTRTEDRITIRADTVDI